MEQILALNEASQIEVLSNCTGPACANIFPYKYFSKTCWTIAEFHLAFPGGVVPNVGRKRLKQIGLFYLHAKVMWNSLLCEERAIKESPVDERQLDKILCFFKATETNTSKEYIAEQANILIQKMKTMAHDDIEGFSVYKNCRYNAENQSSLVIEFPLRAGACGERFIKDLIEFDQDVYDISFSFGLFQYHGSFAL